MHSHSTLLAFGAAIMVVSAVNHQMHVGQDGFSFTPSTLTAAPGDTVEFLFYPFVSALRYNLNISLFLPPRPHPTSLTVL